VILVDTSVWIDFLRGGDSSEAGALAAAIETGDDVCICGLILTEILQGIREESQYRRARRLLDVLVYLPASREVHVLAASIYRAARARGETIRNTVDCVIAACAIAHRVPLLQRDRDFEKIAAVSKLGLAQA